MKQAWEDLGTDFAGHEKVVIGDVDCTQHQSVCQTHGVRGYPTIKFFKVSQQRRVLYRAPAPPASLGFPPWNSARQPGLFTDAITNAIPNAAGREQGGRKVLGRALQGRAVQVRHGPDQLRSADGPSPAPRNDDQTQRQ